MARSWGMLRRMTNKIIKRRTGARDRERLQQLCDSNSLSSSEVIDIRGDYYELRALARGVLYDLGQAEGELRDVSYALECARLTRPGAAPPGAIAAAELEATRNRLRDQTLKTAFYAHRAYAWKRLLKLRGAIARAWAARELRHQYEDTKREHGRVIQLGRLTTAMLRIYAELHCDPPCAAGDPDRAPRGACKACGSSEVQGFCAGCFARRVLQQNGVEVPA